MSEKVSYGQLLAEAANGYRLFSPSNEDRAIPVALSMILLPHLLGTYDHHDLLDTHGQ